MDDKAASDSLSIVVEIYQFVMLQMVTIKVYTKGIMIISPWNCRSNIQDMIVIIVYDNPVLV